MDFKEVKIGYVPYSPDLSQPADRRRFPYFAKRNGVTFEIADTNKFYDVVLLPAPSNLSQWLVYKKKHPDTRFIFEMVDSLIFSTDTFNTLFRGVGRFLQRREKYLYPDFKTPVIKWLKIADVVICSSTELKRIIDKWNRNVIISLDYLQNEARSLKKEYEVADKLKLVWEGQGGVLPHFLHFKEVFQKVSSFCELHVITDEKYTAYGNMIYKDVSKILDQLPITTIFHKWEIYKNYQELSKYDCGIIPLNKKNAFGWHKPANKLISFWFTGLPTLVSNTPAYTEMMNDAGENLYCSSNEEWVAKIHRIKNMKAEERSALAQKNLKYVNQHFSDEALDLVWFKVLKQLTAL
jgi:glycosyltransferase involved in cell wall biosynthesis